jgi:cytochrome b involved in lipid metabolism
MFFSSHLYIKFNNNWYDIIEMSHLHPNGEKIFKKYKNKDITDIFYNNLHHNGIKEPEKILEKYLVTDIKIIKKLNK